MLSGFFVVRGARRAGIGPRAVRDVVARHPGRWEVAFQHENAAAGHFWRRVATEIACDAWTEDRRPVPGRPSLPPDIWISFEVPAQARGFLLRTNLLTAPAGSSGSFVASCHVMVKT